MPNFIVSPVAVVLVQRQSQRDAIAVVHVDVAQVHSLALTSSVDVWASRWNLGVADFCVWSGSFLCDTFDDKIHTHTGCLIVRVCLGSDVWGCSSTRRYDDNTDILVVRLCRRSLVAASVTEWSNRTRMMVAMTEMVESLLKFVEWCLGREK